MEGSRSLQARSPNNQTPYFRVTFEAFRCLFHDSCYLLHGEALTTFLFSSFFLFLSPNLKNALYLQKLKKKWSFVNFITFDPCSFDYIKFNLLVF
jgi:hypothetical protein